MGVFRYFKEEYGINSWSDLAVEGAIPMQVQKRFDELKTIGIPELDIGIVLSEVDPTACKNLLHRYLLEAPKGRGWREFTVRKASKLKRSNQLRYSFFTEFPTLNWVYKVDADSYYELVAILMMLQSKNAPKEWDDNAIAFVKEMKSRFVQK